MENTTYQYDSLHDAFAASIGKFDSISANLAQSITFQSPVDFGAQ
jgi:hypothetical protein